MNFSQYSRNGFMLNWLSLVILAALLFAGCSTASENPSQMGSSQAGHSANSPQSSHSQAGNAASASPTPRIPAFFESAESAKPLPAVLDPAQFSDPIISKAYYIAKLNPELFAQQPCYCYCDTGHGHRSLLDCYVSEHGAGCALCLKEAYFIDKLHKEGKNTTEIRDLIVRREWQHVKLE
jgi:uncharacterized protein with PCYCGC motif